MQYLGGKARIGKRLVEAMGANERPEGVAYVEPFCGACGVARHVIGRRILSDSNHYMIAFWKAIVGGWVPPSELSEEEYSAIKASPDEYPPELVAFAMVGCSFGGKWGAGYARYRRRSYAAMARRSTIKTARLLSGAEFRSGDYRDMMIPSGSLVYCDPPYRGTAIQRIWGSFDSDEFWEWAREKARENTVFVSEGAAPTWAEIVWEKELTRDMRKKGSKIRVDRLYRVPPP